jgi:hypothetical protein
MTYWRNENRYENTEKYLALGVVLEISDVKILV